jgi:hypothetical protein
MSYEFYQGQMSGNLPAWNALLYSKGGWKKSAHLDDGSPIGADLVGGFYDAGGAQDTTAGGAAAAACCVLGSCLLDRPLLLQPCTPVTQAHWNT